MCTNGQDELHCPRQINSALTCPGTVQEYCLTDARYATRIPDGVSDEEAGPISVAESRHMLLVREVLHVQGNGWCCQVLEVDWVILLYNTPRQWDCEPLPSIPENKKKSFA
jgi:NADPH:quinone reductase-like Zn-dependent oxidoreductase